MNWREITANDWDDLTRILARFANKDPIATTFVFRGHAKPGWLLEPSLIRIENIRDFTTESWHELEKQTIKRFKAVAHQYLDAFISLKAGDCTAYWCLMQHHRAPTRLLDWSRSPYVAAYFAVSEHIQDDGVLWIFDAAKLQNQVRKIHGSQMKLPEDDSECEKFYFSSNPKARVLFIGEPTTATHRMRAQQGLFTVSPTVFSDHGQLIDSLLSPLNDENSHLKVILPKSQKKHFLMKLRDFNLTGHSLFPGIDGVGRDIAETFSLIE